MDDRSLELAADYVSARYLDAGRESLQATARVLRTLLAQRRCPEEGLSDPAIQLVLRQLALMDTNNFAAHVGGGEREGRVISNLVRQRHFDLTHGIGRSGDLVAEQPKAGGSSLLYKLTNVLMLDFIRLAGAPSTKAALVVPMATGMTLALVLRCVAKSRRNEVAQQQQQQQRTQKADEKAPEASSQEKLKEDANAEENSTFSAAAAAAVVPQYVIWPRIDQKTALKCIDTAGLIPYPVELRRAPPMRRQQANAAKASTAAAPSHVRSAAAAETHAATEEETEAAKSSALFLHCEVDDIAAAVAAVGGPDHVVCVLSTTSCFSPRLPDNTVAIAHYCRQKCIPYVVNNAYGVQSRRIMTRLDAAQRLGRLDYFVQSGDKNFLVPVGGSVVCSAAAEKVAAAAALYAGRASASPIVDLFITALSLGRRGMRELWEARYACREQLVDQLRRFAQERGEVLLVDDDVLIEVNDDRDAEPSRSAGRGSADTSESSGAAKAKRRDAAQPRNDISLAVTMRHFGRANSAQNEGAGGAQKATDADANSTTLLATSASPATSDWAAARAFGARLFRSAVTGPRVILPAPTTATTIAGCTFHNYGMHQEGVPPYPLLVIACGVGMTMDEVSGLMQRLRELWPAK